MSSWHGQASVKKQIDAILLHQQEGRLVEAARLLAEQVEQLPQNRAQALLPPLLARFPSEFVASVPDLLYVQGRLEAIENQWDEAITFLERAKLLYIPAQPTQAARCCLELARLYQHKEDLRTAYYHIEDAASWLADTAEDQLKAELMYRLAEICPDIGQLHKGLEYGQEALKIYRALGDSRGQFSTLMSMVRNARQVGNYHDAASWLEMARQHYRAAQLEPAHYAQVLNGQAHLCWYRGNLATALEWARELKNFADTYTNNNQRMFARILLGNLYRAIGNYEAAQAHYDESRQVIEEMGFSLFLLWVEIHTAWLKVLLGEYDEARALIHRVQGEADQGQRVSFNVFLAGLDILTGHPREAMRLLDASLDYYTRSGDPLASSAIRLYLGLAHSSVGQSEESARYLDEGLGWFAEKNIDYFPHWWHPQLVTDVCILALRESTYPDLAERMVLNHVKEAAIPRLRELQWDEDRSASLRAARILRLIGDKSSQTGGGGPSSAKAILDELLTQGYLHRDNFPRLLAELTTATHRQKPNPVLVAVFALYLQDYPAPDIAARLNRSEKTVKNYITAIYDIFNLPADAFGTRRERRNALRNRARERGYI